MKNTFFLAVLLLSTTVFAQKVDKTSFALQKKTGNIIANYQVVGKLVKTKATMIGMQKNFSIRNPEDDELLYIKYRQTKDYTGGRKPNGEREYNTVENFDFNFIESGAKVTLVRTIGLGEKGLMKILGTDQLMNIDGSINMDNVESFVMKNGGQFVEEQKSKKSPKLSEALVTVNDELEIWQEDKHLGKVIERHTDEALVFHIYDTKGSKIAKATIDKADMLEWKLVDWDDKKYTVLYEGDGSGIQILTYMASNGWFN